MMKTSEEFLLEEVKDAYSRYLSTWKEINHKSYSFLQLNAMLLSIIIIGMGFLLESVTTDFVVLLTISSIFIILSIFYAIRAIHNTSIKEIDIKLDSTSELKGGQIKILKSFIKSYNVLIYEINKKNQERILTLRKSSKHLLVGLVLLSGFIAMLTINKLESIQKIVVLLQDILNNS